MKKQKQNDPDKLLRDMKRNWVAGVCAGLGKYLYLDVSLIRIVFTFLLLSISPIAITVYVVAWIIIPPGPTIPDERLYADDFDDDELN